MDARKYKGAFVDESVDIPPMGYMIFILLTGLWPYYDFPENQVKVVQELAVKGFMPRISPSFKRRSLIETRLVELMYRCIDPDVARRPDAFEIVRYLRETRTMHENELSKADSNFSFHKGRTLV
jgi:serine/threonine protein kinase